MTSRRDVTGMMVSKGESSLSFSYFRVSELLYKYIVQPETPP